MPRKKAAVTMNEGATTPKQVNPEGGKPPGMVDMRQRTDPRNTACAVCHEPIKYSSAEPAQRYHYSERYKANIHESCTAAQAPLRYDQER